MMAVAQCRVEILWEGGGRDHQGNDDRVHGNITACGEDSPNGGHQIISIAAIACTSLMPEPHRPSPTDHQSTRHYQPTAHQHA